MQYLLSETEYNTLQRKADYYKNKSNDQLQEVCTYAAENVPILFWGNAQPEPWGCILSKDKHTAVNYCDECPVQEQCPHDNKVWSK